MERSLEPYLRDAEQLIESGCIKDCEFSEGTYQILVDDPQEGELWPFLQFGLNNKIKDAFCSCAQSEESGLCAHIAAAYSIIFKNNTLPLHVRFRDSIWHLICYDFCDQYGGDLRSFTPLDTSTIEVKNNQKRVFYIKAKDTEGEKFIERSLLMRPKETEENSIKFSNLSDEELSYWHEGRPSLSLRYELSFWGDLAKHCMLMQDEEVEYSCSFAYSEENIPNFFTISFPSFVIGFEVEKKLLASLIPAIAKIETPLNVVGLHENAIECLEFHSKTGAMSIVWNKKVRRTIQLWCQDHEQPIELNKWMYVPFKGFFPRNLPLLSGKSELQAQDITGLFKENLETIKSNLRGVTLNLKKVKPSYNIYFDDEWNLCVEMYLFKESDLLDDQCYLYGDWAYICGKGFYPLEGPLFDKVLTRIKPIEVSDFVYHYKKWLNGFKGFTTHISNIDSHLSYKFDPYDGINFLSKAEFSDEDSEHAKDFGDWIYISGEGFYSKSRKKVGVILRSGLSVPLKGISAFVHMNREELEFVENFFLAKGPFKQVGLKAQFLPSGILEITPDLVMRKDFRKSEISFYGEVVYVKNKGFFILPKDLSLPSYYKKKVLIQPEELNWFLSSELDGLKKYITKLDPKLKKPTEWNYKFKGADLVRQEKKEPLWHLQIALSTDLGEVKLNEIWRALENKKRFIFTKAGLLDTSLEIFKWVRETDVSKFRFKKNVIRLNTLELLRLDALESPLNDIKNKEEHRLLDSVIGLHAPSEMDLTKLQSVLRPYQLYGANWLWFLYSYDLSGLLCDDMGLGKTHQTMALIAAASVGEVRKKVLIVCPTSVIFHWQDKLSEFLPSLKVYTYFREQRDLKYYEEEADILLTSYGLLRFDQKKFFKLHFDMAVFDEIQMAKNAHSQTFQVLSKLKASMRLGLTGTPIENNLKELKNLFDLAIPKYMPSDEAFRSFFLNPIEREGDKARKELLSRYIKPFVLRRKKAEVLSDLPEKTEEKFYCYCSSDQAKLYQELLASQGKVLLDDLASGNKKVSYIHIFALLTKLKQVCNHPALIHGDIKNYEKYASSKWKLFLQLLHQALDSKQKIVVFSQYLGMLDIIQAYLNSIGVQFSSLRGNTKDRDVQLKKFANDPEVEVFVCSLKAGGLGIDLTAASVVIHYDRWWNAARENQATDRVHRMGQTRGVQVFKLITRQTLEERIDQIIEGKAGLMDDVIHEDTDEAKILDRNTLIELLRIVPQS